MNSFRAFVFFSFGLLLINPVWAFQTPKKDLYIQKLSQCPSIGMEKRFFPKGSLSTHRNTDSVILKYGCVGTEPDTFYYVRNNEDNPNSEAMFENELKTFSDLVKFYKTNPAYQFRTFLSDPKEEVKVEKYLFEKKQ